MNGSPPKSKTTQTSSLYARRCTSRKSSLNPVLFLSTNGTKLIVQFDSQAVRRFRDKSPRASFAKNGCGLDKWSGVSGLAWSRNPRSHQLEPSGLGRQQKPE